MIFTTRAVWTAWESRRDLGAGLKPGRHIAPDFREFIDSIVEFPRFLNHQHIDTRPKMLVGLLRLQNGGRPEAGFRGEPLGHQAQELRGICFQACKVRCAREGQRVIVNLKQAAHHGNTHGGVVNFNLWRLIQQQV